MLDRANSRVIRAVGVALEHVAILRAETRVIGGCAGVDLTLDGSLTGVENAFVMSVKNRGSTGQDTHFCAAQELLVVDAAAEVVLVV